MFFKLYTSISGTYAYYVIKYKFKIFENLKKNHKKN